MTPGSRLSCYGIPGDGCGGGREFVIENEELYALDPVTKEKIVLLDGIKDAKSISKNGCHIIIMTLQEKIIFNLSSLNVQKSCVTIPQKK